VSFNPQKGSGVFRPSGESEHLFVLMTNVNERNQHYCVNITSVPEAGQYYDQTCVLDRGLHPFIAHPSYVYYAMATTIHRLHLLNMLGRGYYREAASFEEGLLQRISAGVSESRDTPRWFKMDYATAIRRGF
jgi:hypothetical protein